MASVLETTVIDDDVVSYRSISPEIDLSTFTLSAIQLDPAVSQLLISDIISKFEEIRWSAGKEADIFLAELIVTKLLTGVDQNQFATELVSDNILEQDEIQVKLFSEWLFQQVKSLGSQLDEGVHDTPFASRYGRSTARQFRNTGKSGITPIHPPDIKVIQTERELRRAQNHEKIQRRKLNSFATWELENSGCWLQADATPSDLIYCPEIGIQPCFSRENWIPGNIPLDLPFEGVWSGQNDMVWNALGPSIRLATLIINGSFMLPW